MEINVGLIRDRQGIYEGLQQSKSSGHQLALCYNNGGKLFVTIAAVKDIVSEKQQQFVVLMAPDETKIPLDQIETIYPIHDYPH